MVKKIIGNVQWFLNKNEKDSLETFSAHVSYFMIISFIPFVLFFLSILHVINVNGENLLLLVIELLPSDVAGVFSEALGIVGEPIAILSISALTCIWSSSKAMLALLKGLNVIFDVNETRNFIRLRIAAILYTFVFIAVLAATTILLLIGSAVYQNVFDYFNINISLNFLGFKWVIGVVILAVFFTCLYKLLVQKSKISLKNCFFGAVLASFGWAAFSTVFSFAVENFIDYSVIYGTLASLIALMFWLFICVYILLFGAQFAVWLQNRKEINKSLEGEI